MTRWEYRARYVFTKIADMTLKSPRFWHPGPEVGHAIGARFEAKVHKGADFVKLQIGANDLSHGDSSNAGGGDEVLAFLRLQSGSYRLIFVEANAMLEESLRRNVGRLFPSASESRVISAAVCESAGVSVPFYRLSAAFYERHPELRTLSQMSSLDRSWIEQCRAAFPHVNLTEGWEETQVRCITPADLLKETDLNAEDVDAVTLDVEGLETQLLGLFLSLEGFAPVLLEFDAFTQKYAQKGSRFVENALVPLLERLAALGYDVHHSADGIVALRA